MLVSVEGTSPVIVDITKMQDVNSGIQYPFFIGGLAVAVAEGILIGIVIGKLKFGQDDG